MAISPCKTCGKLLSWEEYVCPRCGTRDPVERPGSDRTERADSPDASPVLGLLTGCLLLLLAGLGALVLLSWAEALFRAGSP